jgi:hypothetical protein
MRRQPRVWLRSYHDLDELFNVLLAQRVNGQHLAWYRLGDPAQGRGEAGARRPLSNLTPVTIVRASVRR